MKTLHLLIIVILFSACSDSGKKYPEYHAGTIPATKQETAPLPNPETRPAAVLYAEAILAGQIKLSENNETFAWLDSLQSSDPVTRQLAYRVTEIIINKGQGFLAESAGGHLKAYFQIYPKDFLTNYRAALPAMQKKLIENTAYEFYASGTDYAVDVDTYFKEIVKACINCTTADNQVTDDIRTKIRQLLKAKNE